MKAPEVGTTLGKCIFDNGVIVEGQSIRSQYATLRQGKWICGECLLDMLPVRGYTVLYDRRSREER